MGNIGRMTFREWRKLYHQTPRSLQVHPLMKIALHLDRDLEESFEGLLLI